MTYKSAQWARCIDLTFYSKCQSNKHVDGDSQKLTDSVQVLKGFFVSAPFWSTVGLAVKLLGLTHSSQPSLSSSRGEEGFKNMSLCVPHSKYGIKENKQEFVDGNALTFILLKLNLDPFLLSFFCVQGTFFSSSFFLLASQEKKPPNNNNNFENHSFKKKKGTLVHLSKEIWGEWMIRETI